MKTSPVHLMLLGMIGWCSACSGNEPIITPTPVPTRTITVSPDVACSLAGAPDPSSAEEACGRLCGDMIYNTCALPAGYVRAYDAAPVDAAVDASAGLVAPSLAYCPAGESSVDIQCNRSDF